MLIPVKLTLNLNHESDDEAILRELYHQLDLASRADDVFKIDVLGRLVRMVEGGRAAARSKK
jgi:hypothetical protein